ncbi:MAG: hypothetical protein A3K10_09255 [Bacteroidetes bacterium RIFCSPLOWO2_12_FULL_31_6]|nr:MAG: hypothetical protein A3K10_09255 [Bacteroidetes bacterium RIFCSPLOWO2_12_FULL_31_6]
MSCRIFFTFLLLLFFGSRTFCQCPQLIEGDGNHVNSFYWINSDSCHLDFLFQSNNNSIIHQLYTSYIFPKYLYTQTDVYDILLITSISNNCIDKFTPLEVEKENLECGISISSAFTSIGRNLCEEFSFL